MAHISRPFAILGILLVAAVTVAVAAAQQPRIDNGRITTQPAGSPFGQSVRALVSSQADVAWIGYSVPVVDGERMMCCFESGSTWVNGTVVVSNASTCCQACRLEPSSSTSMTTRPPQSQGGVVK